MPALSVSIESVVFNGSRGKLKGSVCDLSRRCGADGGYQCQALSGEWLREQEMARPRARSKAAWKRHSSHISMAASLISITWICMIGVDGRTGNRGRLCVIGNIPSDGQRGGYCANIDTAFILYYKAVIIGRYTQFLEFHLCIGFVQPWQISSIWRR